MARVQANIALQMREGPLFVCDNCFSHELELPVTLDECKAELDQIDEVAEICPRLVNSNQTQI